MEVGRLLVSSQLVMAVGSASYGTKASQLWHQGQLVMHSASYGCSQLVMDAIS